MARDATERSFQQAADKIERFARELEDDPGEGARQIGEEIMTDVKASRSDKGVPVDTGTLRSSGRVSGPNARGEVTLTFGGPAAPYALFQHETLELSHVVGEARYLVRGVERWTPGGSAAIRALKANAEQAVRIASRG